MSFDCKDAVDVCKRTWQETLIAHDAERFSRMGGSKRYKPCEEPCSTHPQELRPSSSNQYASGVIWFVRTSCARPRVGRDHLINVASALTRVRAFTQNGECEQAPNLHAGLAINLEQDVKSSGHFALGAVAYSSRLIHSLLKKPLLSGKAHAAEHLKAICRLV